MNPNPASVITPFIVFSTIFGLSFLSSQILFAQPTENKTSATLDITKLTGDEKIEVTGSFGPEELGTFGAHQLDSKPVIKIDGKILNYELANPSSVGYISISPDGTILYNQEIKVPVGNDTSKIITLYYIETSNTIQEKPDKTIYTSDNESYTNDPHSISIDDVTMKNVVEYIEVDNQNSSGLFKFVN